MRASRPVPASADGTRRSTIPTFPSAAARRLVDAGLEPFGALDVPRYDALVPAGWHSEQVLPDARSAWVIGSGGAKFARAALAEGGADPIDRATRRGSSACVGALVEAGHRAVALHAFERRNAGGVLAHDATDEAGRYADFSALGRAAGLGAPSRLRLLVHPVFGPWLAVRSVVLTTARLPTTGPIPGFDPCRDCAAPCRDACPAGALDGGDLAWDVCRPERLRGGPCALHCGARRACVVGREHAYPDEVDAHSMRASLRIAAHRNAH